MSTRPANDLERGDLRLILLAMLNAPMHGYGIISEVKSKTCGRYRPSCGAIYPQLRRLSEEGAIEHYKEGGKTLYAITKKGREELRRNKRAINEIESRVFGPCEEGIVLLEQIKRVNALLARISGIEVAPMPGNKVEKTCDILNEFECKLRRLWGFGGEI